MSSKPKISSVGIVGFGAFGQLIAAHLHNHFPLVINDQATRSTYCSERHLLAASWWPQTLVRWDFPGPGCRRDGQPFSVLCRLGLSVCPRFRFPSLPCKSHICKFARLSLQIGGTNQHQAPSGTASSYAFHTAVRIVFFTNLIIQIVAGALGAPPLRLGQSHIVRVLLDHARNALAKCRTTRVCSGSGPSGKAPTGTRQKYPK